MADSKPVQTAPSEDILSAKTDLCLSNALVKTGISFGVGVVLSAVLFRRRAWPLVFGIGFGAGQGYSDCNRIFNPAAVPGFSLAHSGPHAGASHAEGAFGALEARKDELAALFSHRTQEAKAKAEDVKDVALDKAREIKGEARDEAAQLKNKAEDLKKRMV